MELVRIQARAWHAMVEHARAEAPNECCGLLLGRDEVVDECVPARNVHQSPTRYEVDPSDHFAAIRLARATARRIIGAYHSHTHSPAVPSPTDLSEAHDPELLYVIVSLAEGEDVKGYRLDEGRFVIVPILRVASTKDEPTRD